MKIVDRMCNVKWWRSDRGNSNTGVHEGVFKEHSQPTTDSDYSVPGYCTLSIWYDTFCYVFWRFGDRNQSLQSDARHAIGCEIGIVYPEDRGRSHENKDRLNRSFAVRAVTMARNYRTHEIDHVVLTLEELDAGGEWGGCD